MFPFASVPTDLPFCRTEFTATFHSDVPWPPERSEAEKLIRDYDNAFDFPLLSDFADGYVKGYSQRVQSKGYSQRVKPKGTVKGYFYKECITSPEQRLDPPQVAKLTCN